MAAEEHKKNPLRPESYWNQTDFVDAVTVFRVRKGWSVEVSDKSDASPCESVHFAQLQAGDELEVRRFGVAFVGGKFRLSAIAAAEKFNGSLQAKVGELAREYVGFRKIRGDGNCYYRATVYGLLEFAIVTDRREMLQTVHDCFRDRVRFDAQTEQEWHKQHQCFLDHLLKATREF